jgi:hypothetical protein
MNEWMVYYIAPLTRSKQSDEMKYDFIYLSSPPLTRRGDDTKELSDENIHIWLYITIPYYILSCNSRCFFLQYTDGCCHLSKICKQKPSKQY